MFFFAYVIIDIWREIEIVMFYPSVELGMFCVLKSDRPKLLSGEQFNMFDGNREIKVKIGKTHTFLTLLRLCVALHGAINSIMYLNQFVGSKMSCSHEFNILLSIDRRWWRQRWRQQWPRNIEFDMLPPNMVKLIIKTEHFKRPQNRNYMSRDVREWSLIYWNNLRAFQFGWIWIYFFLSSQQFC